eukprot:740507-Rhodomonas_salina.2
MACTRDLPPEDCPRTPARNAGKIRTQLGSWDGAKRERERGSRWGGAPPASMERNTVNIGKLVPFLPSEHPLKSGTCWRKQSKQLEASPHVGSGGLHMARVRSPQLLDVSDT